MLLETHVDVVLFRETVIKDENGDPVMENGRPKIERRVMLFDNNEGFMLPGGPIPEITPEQCDGCDPFDDNAPAEFVAMNIVEHLTGLGPEHIDDATYHQYRWQMMPDRMVAPDGSKRGKAVVYYYAVVREETDSEKASVEEILKDKHDIKFFSESDFDSPTFIWAGGEYDEVIIREILSLFKPHIEQ
jgi:hypothetical protein